MLATRNNSIMYRKTIAYLLFISSLLFALLFFLLEGLTIKSISLPGIKIKQLYIKLDKKLIVDAQEIAIVKQSNVENSLDNIKKDVYKIPLYLEYFEKIHVEKLLIDGNEFIIDINDDIFFVDNKFINISAKPIFDKKRISLQLYSLYLKDKKILLTGDVLIDYNKEEMLFNGKYNRKNLDGNLVFKADTNYFDFSINSNSVDNIHFVKEFVSLDETVEQWMYDNVLGTYKLDTLTGRFSTRNFQPLPKSFKGEATVSKGKIKFHSDLDYVNTDKITVRFENDKLYFDLKNPKYKDISIDGSAVVIHNITEDGSNIDINILSKSILNNDVLNIIEAYGAKLPIKQLDGMTDAKLQINVDFQTSVVRTNGAFETKQATFRLNELEFMAKNAKVTLNDNLVHIKESEVHYKDNLVADLDLLINTTTSSAIGNTKIISFNIKSDEQEILNLKDRKSSLSVDFSEDLKVILDNLDTSVHVRDKSIDVNIQNLETLYGQSGLLQELKANYGELFLSIITFDNILFKADVFKLDLPIKREGEFITSLNVEGSVVNGLTQAHTKDDKILLHMTDQLIDLELNDTDVLFDAKTSGLNQVKQNLKILLKNSKININDNYNFDVDNFNIMKNSKGLFLDGEIYNLDLPLLENGKKLEKLSVKGDYRSNILNVNTKDEKISIKVNENEQVVVTLNGVDIKYDSSSNDNLDDKNIILNGVDSSIIINDKYTLLSDKYNLVLYKNKISFDSFYKESLLNLKQDESGLKKVKGSNLSSELINTFLATELITGGKVNIESSGFKDNLSGHIILTDNKVKNLAFLTNLLLFLNTSPVLINPLFVIPTAIDLATNKGGSTDGYVIKNGTIDFEYDLDKDIFNATKIVTKGATVDFDGNAVLDFNKQIITSSMNVGFLKSYTNLVKEIPVVGYILLGEDEKVTTKVEISGNLSDPEYKTNLLKDGASLPVDVLRRILNLPKKALDAIIK